MRNTTSNILVGAQRTGKTTFAKSIADVYPADKKVLVVCPDDFEPAWKSYRLIQSAQIPALKAGKHRVMYDPKDKKFLALVADNFRDGLIIWDDAKVYFNTQPKIFELEAMLIRRRQYNFDVMFMYHGLSTIPALLWTYATHLTLFRTNDAFQRSAYKTLNPELMESIVARVKKEAEKDPYYKEIISLQ